MVWRATGIDPGQFDIVVVGRDDDGLASTTFEAAGHEIDVHSWPEDSEWAAFVEAQLTNGLPAIEELIGQPPPTDRPLRIVETVTPYIYGYGGWYEPTENRIEIGDDLDPVLMLHELSHMWFNSEFITGRWIGEAFAEEYAHRAQAMLVDPATVPGPELLAPDHPGRQPLNQWRDPQTFDELTDQQERYAYNAGWAVLRAISDEIGVDRLGDVTEAMLDRTIAYRGDGDPEHWGGATDWRRLLDLVEELGGSTTASDHFAANVVTPAQAPELVRRAETRQLYDALEAQGGEWAPPEGIRAAMGRWDFDEATPDIERAHAVLAVRDQVDAVLGRAGFEVPAAFEDDYEGADDLERLEIDAGRYLDASEALVAADDAVDAGDGLFGAIGLLGADPEGKVDRAADRLAAGDTSRPSPTPSAPSAWSTTPRRAVSSEWRRPQGALPCSPSGRPCCAVGTGGAGPNGRDRPGSRRPGHGARPGTGCSRATASASRSATPGRSRRAAAACRAAMGGKEDTRYRASIPSSIHRPMSGGTIPGSHARSVTWRRTSDHVRTRPRAAASSTRSSGRTRSPAPLSRRSAGCSLATVLHGSDRPCRLASSAAASASTSHSEVSSSPTAMAAGSVARPKHRRMTSTASPASGASSMRRPSANRVQPATCPERVMRTRLRTRTASGWADGRRRSGPGSPRARRRRRARSSRQ